VVRDPEARVHFNLWSQVVRIASHHQPQYLILENVPNLTRHANGQTWKQIEAELRAIGYDVKAKALSPDRFSIPQIRERVYIVASRGGLQRFTWPVETHLMEPSVHEILDSNPPDARPLSGQVVECLDVWQDFLDHYPQDLQLPSYPIWSMEFAATFPYLESTPWATDPSELRAYRGSYGTGRAGLLR
jgi:DNA (cytosine-5)-methyltransferase 1